MQDRFLRVWQVIGDQQRGIEALFPVSRSQWWQGVKDGRYPPGVKLSARCTAWRASDIQRLIDTVGA